MKPKHQCYLSQWEERVYGTQSWKERRLLFESVFHLIDRWSLILKMAGRKGFLMNPKHLFIYPNEKNEFNVLNLEQKRDCYVNPFLTQLINKLQLQKMRERGDILMKPKLKCHSSQ